MDSLTKGKELSIAYTSLLPRALDLERPRITDDRRIASFEYFRIIAADQTAHIAIFSRILLK